ncbi:MAG: hypothetical protein LKE54_08620 [Prevotella sp.]|nr:hypothetical protein [Prevotella sp.]MCH3995094.1 hypothetical protein [Prevotella sp.]
MSDNKVFTVPSEVSFAAGERSKVVPVTFNIPIGETDTLNVSLDSAQAYIYAPSSKRFIVKRDYVWIDLGQGQWTSSIFSQSSAVEVFKAGGQMFIVSKSHMRLDMILILSFKVLRQ